MGSCKGKGKRGDTTNTIWSVGTQTMDDNYRNLCRHAEVCVRPTEVFVPTDLPRYQPINQVKAGRWEAVRGKENGVHLKYNMVCGDTDHGKVVNLRFGFSSYFITIRKPKQGISAHTMRREIIQGESSYRNSQMDFDKVYFWTDTVKEWKHLLQHDNYKKLIISSLSELKNRSQIIIYAFVIMPNHIHLIWELKKPNGKEKPHASFNKFTSHLIVSDLKQKHPEMLSSFKVEEKERQHRIWQRDPLAILMDTRQKVEQKIEYIHNNPLQTYWNLADRPEDYSWSSAEFYTKGVDRFKILTHYRDRF